MGIRVPASFAWAFHMIPDAGEDGNPAFSNPFDFMSFLRFCRYNLQSSGFMANPCRERNRIDPEASPGLPPIRKALSKMIKKELLKSKLFIRLIVAVGLVAVALAVLTVMQRFEGGESQTSPPPAPPKPAPHPVPQPASRPAPVSEPAPAVVSQPFPPRFLSRQNPGKLFRLSRQRQPCRSLWRRDFPVMSMWRKSGILRRFCPARRLQNMPSAMKAVISPCSSACFPRMKIPKR